MVSYAAGTRYLSLLGGTCLGFYDWYCDLPPSGRLVQFQLPDPVGLECSKTRIPDAHFYTEVRYKGAKSVVIGPDSARPPNYVEATGPGARFVPRADDPAQPGPYTTLTRPEMRA